MCSIAAEPFPFGARPVARNEPWRRNTADQPLRRLGNLPARMPAAVAGGNAGNLVYSSLPAQLAGRIQCRLTGKSRPIAAGTDRR